jgi:NDP-sugar pyrophosphorylase family protein
VEGPQGVQVAILCGGLATRMRPLSERLPKSLFPVAGRPFLDWQLEGMARRGVTDVVLCTGHMGDAIFAHVGDGSRFGLRIACSDEGEHKLGTGGALALAASRGLLQARFVAQYGDSYLRLDYPALAAARGEAVMSVYHNEGRHDPSNCVVAGGRVVVYEKGTRRADAVWIDYGATALDLVLVLAPPRDLAELYARLSAEGRLASYEVSERFNEVGSPAGLAELDRLLSEGAA